MGAFGMDLGGTDEFDVGGPPNSQGQEDDEPTSEILGGAWGGLPLGPQGWAYDSRYGRRSDDWRPTPGWNYPYVQGVQRFPPIAAESIPALQVAFYETGLLSDNFRPGVWDSATISAFTQVLQLANREGIGWQAALEVFRRNPTLKQLEQLRSRGGGGGGVTRRIRLTNANDLQAVANEVAPRTIGRRLTDDELRKFVSSYHAAERGETAGDPSVAAQLAAEQAAPTEATAQKFVDVYKVIHGMVSGG